MKIVIVTDGSGANTKLFFNGAEQKAFREFNISVFSARKAKLQLVKEVDGRNEFLSYYGDDFRMYDKTTKTEEKENGKQ
ncbi:MAG: hypothetical protein ABIH42_10350 [Planctomycetota bacterium]